MGAAPRGARTPKEERLQPSPVPNSLEQLIGEDFGATGY